MNATPTQDDILDSLRARPMTLDDLMADTGRTACSVQRAVWRLRERGVVVEVGRAKRRRAKPCLVWGVRDASTR